MRRHVSCLFLRRRYQPAQGGNMTQFWNKKRMAFSGQHGFTLIELLIVVAIIEIGRATSRAREEISEVAASLKKNQADARALASAVSIYGAHMGALPTSGPGGLT